MALLNSLRMFSVGLPRAVSPSAHALSGSGRPDIAGMSTAPFPQQIENRGRLLEEDFRRSSIQSYALNFWKTTPMSPKLDGSASQPSTPEKISAAQRPCGRAVPSIPDVSSSVSEPSLSNQTASVTTRLRSSARAAESWTRAIAASSGESACNRRRDAAWPEVISACADAALSGSVSRRRFWRLARIAASLSRAAAAATGSCARRALRAAYFSRLRRRLSSLAVFSATAR